MIRSGTEIEPLALADCSSTPASLREDPVDEHGSFTIRGGIVDVFPLRRWNRFASSSSATWSSRSAASIRHAALDRARPTSILIVPVRERF
jgi:transcription-repair coupling factor (superfamily II helicase)